MIRSQVPVSPIPSEVRKVLHRPDGEVVYRVRPTPNAQPGNPIVFIHGLASNMSRWAELVRVTSLIERHNLIRVDLRGHGESMTRRRFVLSDWCEDLRQLLDVEQTRQAVLVGHSLGATVAMQFAAVAPQRVAAMVLVDPVFREAVVAGKRQYVRVGPIFDAAARAVRGLNALGLYRRRLVALDLEHLDRQARAALSDPAARDAFVRRYSAAREDLRHIPLANYLQDWVEIFRPIASLAAIAAPVLVLRSAFADFQDETAVKRRLGQLQWCHVETIDCHHWPVTEQPAEVRRWIETWVGQYGAGAAP